MEAEKYNERRQSRSYLAFHQPHISRQVKLMEPPFFFCYAKAILYYLGLDSPKGKSWVKDREQVRLVIAGNRGEVRKWDKEDMVSKRGYHCSHCFQSRRVLLGSLWESTSELSHPRKRKLADLCKNSHLSKVEGHSWAKGCQIFPA